jgi:lipopolysaccharide transport system permease protein
LIVHGGSPRGFVASLRELWSFRQTIKAFIERDVRLKYRRVMIGIAWAALQPLAFMALLSFTLGRSETGARDGASYAALSLGALIGWNYLNSAVSFGASALLSDAAILRKVYLPREVPVLGAVVSASLEFGVGFALFALVGPLLGTRPAYAWLLAPVFGALLVLLAAGSAMLLAALNAYYRDFRYVLPFILQCWFLASPVAYRVNALPAAWQPIYLWVNPAAGLLESLRLALALGTAPALTLIGPSVIGTLAVVIAGYSFFKSLERRFSDRIV